MKLKKRLMKYFNIDAAVPEGSKGEGCRPSLSGVRIPPAAKFQ